MYVRWSDDLRVGVERVDEQHMKLVGMVTQLYETMLKGEGQTILAEIISGLYDYTVTHFGTEESLFAQHAYPAAPGHIEQHRYFTEQVADFKRGYEEKRLMLSLDVMDFLSDWLVDHIQVMDKAFGRYLNEHGVH